MSRLSLEEQETIINIERLSQTAHIYTCDARYINKLDKLVEASDEWKCIGQDEVSKEYECPVNLISFRKSTQKRELTEEQLEVLRERGREIRRAQISRATGE